MKTSITFISIVKETEKAILLRLADESTIWMPFSQVEIDRASDVVTMPTWLANKKADENRFIGTLIALS